MAFAPPKPTLGRRITALAVALLVCVSFVPPALAQSSGAVASAVLVTENSITIDGQLNDWENIPATVTVDGPQPSADPAATGRLRWQIAADPDTIFFAATITDEVIVAGQHGGDYWNEDSFEFYLNLSGDLAATSYGPGISQIRISAVDIGRNDPALLTLTGIGLDQHEVTGFVFETSDGWGAEFAVDVAGLYEPVERERFGLQVQANGSSGGDRDLKLSWSDADTFDTSFEDPSVFAQGVFVGALATESSAVTDAPAPESIDPASNAEDQAETVESIADDEPEIVTADEQRRSLFIAAIVSSAAVFLGGLWFERKRRADEKRHTEERKAATREKGLPVAATAGTVAATTSASVDGSQRATDPEADTDVDLDTDDFKAMLDSILDDDARTDGYE